MMIARVRPRKRVWLRLVVVIAIATLLGLCQMQSIAQVPPQAADRWEPHLAPAGPVVVLVSLPAQRASVYRNGVRIGTTPVSTGRPGHDTPVGVYPVLEKKREHFSNLYDDAPMPFMQRLTWSGIALHAGNLPGYPASHGCIRLPARFAELLFEVTTPGTLVIVTDSPEADPLLAPAPLQTASGDEAALPVPASTAPISLLLSTHDAMLVVMQGGRERARSPITIGPPLPPAGTTAYVLLEGVLPTPSPILPGRPARPWMVIPVAGGPPAADPPKVMAPARPIRLSPAFAEWLYDLVIPGTVLVVTSEPLARHTNTAASLQSAVPSPPADAPEP